MDRAQNKFDKDELCGYDGDDDREMHEMYLHAISKPEHSECTKVNDQPVVPDCCDCMHGTDRIWGRFCQRSRPGFSDSVLPCSFEREGKASNEVPSWLLTANGPAPKFIPCGPKAKFFEPRIKG